MSLPECLAVDSWPGICHTLLTFVINDLGKKRPDSSTQRVARKFFQQAEGGRRTSRPGMLVHRASRTFVAFQRIISTATLMSPLGQEFGNILRVHLLPVAQYTATATAPSFQGTAMIESETCGFQHWHPGRILRGAAAQLPCKNFSAWICREQ